MKKVNPQNKFIFIGIFAILQAILYYFLTFLLNAYIWIVFGLILIKINFHYEFPQIDIFYHLTTLTLITIGIYFTFYYYFKTENKKLFWKRYLIVILSIIAVNLVLAFLILSEGL